MPWLGRPFVGVGELRRGVLRRRGCRGAVAHTRAVRGRHGHAGARRRSRARAGAERRRPGARSWCARPCSCPGRFRPSSSRWSGASCSRARPDWRPALAAGVGVSAADLVRERARRLAAADSRRRLEDDAVCRASCCSPVCRTSIRRSTRPPTSTAPDPGADSPTSRCRCFGRRCWWRFSSAALDALAGLRLVYVMTGGGPGSATEPIALYHASPRFFRIFASASRPRSRCIMLLVAFVFALVSIRSLGGDAVSRTARMRSRAACDRRRRCCSCWRCCSRCIGRSSHRSRRRAGCSRRRRSCRATLVLDHYRALFATRDFWTPIRNSLVVAGAHDRCVGRARVDLRVRAGAAPLSRQSADCSHSCSPSRCFRRSRSSVPLYLLLRELRLLNTLSRPGAAVSLVRDAADDLDAGRILPPVARRIWRKRR